VEGCVAPFLEAGHAACSTASNHSANQPKPNPNPSPTYPNPCNRYKFSPYLGASQPERDILLFHRGRMGQEDLPSYSRGVRQKVRIASRSKHERMQPSATPSLHPNPCRTPPAHSSFFMDNLQNPTPQSPRTPTLQPQNPLQILKFAERNKWREKHRIHVEAYDDELQGDYSELLARSVFCLVAAGDGWTSRFDDAMLHGW